MYISYRWKYALFSPLSYMHIRNLHLRIDMRRVQARAGQPYGESCRIRAVVSLFQKGRKKMSIFFLYYTFPISHSQASYTDWLTFLSFLLSIYVSLGSLNFPKTDIFKNPSTKPKVRVKWIISFLSSSFPLVFIHYVKVLEKSILYG